MDFFRDLYSFLALPELKCKRIQRLYARDSAVVNQSSSSERGNAIYTSYGFASVRASR